MDTQKFLEAVWPDAGLYCIAVPAEVGYRHYVYNTVGQASALARTLSAKGHDIFFAVHTLENTSIDNPRTGKTSVRIHENMRSCRAFFFDLDVGAEKPYQSKGQALLALKKFCDDADLPRPMLVSSGGGIHCYWLLEDEIPSLDWRGYASTLYNLAYSLGLRPDPARASDQSSVLRVAGTLNRKIAGNPRAVEVLKEATRLPNRAFLDRLPAATVANQPRLRVVAMDDAPGLSTTASFDGVPPPTVRQIYDTCNQMRRMMNLGGNVEEPQWLQMLNVLRFSNGGREAAHKFSMKHPRYSRTETDAKLDQQEHVDPTSCGKMSQTCGAEYCKGCYWLNGSAKGPVAASRKPQPLPDKPKLTVVEGSKSVEADDPWEPKVAPPHGFKFIKGGGVIFEKKNEEGLVEPIKILNCDLFPRIRQVDELSKTDQHEWCFKQPLEDWRVVNLSSSLIHSQTLMGELSNHGIYALSGTEKMVKLFMSLYIQELQRHERSQKQQSHMGWINGREQFVLVDKILNRDGTEEPVYFRKNVEATLVVKHKYGKAGTIEKQRELMDFYDKPEYIKRQFYILAAYAAPMFHAYNLAGAIIHAEGRSGAAKSMALGAAISAWGHPTLSPINATTQGNTVVARNIVQAMLGNLPIPLDEITEMDEEVAKTFALGASQAQANKGRGTTEGDLRLSASDEAQKSTLLITSGNISLHHLLSKNNSAGDAASMRVFEIPFERFPKNNEKNIEAKRFEYALAENYGHLGEQFMRYVMTHYEEVLAAYRWELENLLPTMRWAAEERFWAAIVAAIVATCRLTYKLGLLPFRPEPIIQWLVNEQLPLMRGAVKSQYLSPTETLTNFLETIVDNTVTVSSSGSTGVGHDPRGSIKARYEDETNMLWISRDAFKAYCDRRNVAHMQSIHDLMLQKIIVIGNERKTLTAGTALTSGRSYCFVVDMGHAEMADTTPKFKGAQRPTLRVVPKNSDEGAC